MYYLCIYIYIYIHIYIYINIYIDVASKRYQKGINSV